MIAKKPGFSLVELSVVIAIACLLSALVLFNARALRTSTIHAELSLSHTRIHTLQQKAIVTGVVQTMRFMPEQHAYLWQEQTYTLPKDLQFGVRNGVMGPPSHPTTAITHPVTFTQNILACYPDGIIKSGTIYLIDARKQLYALSCGVADVSFLRKYRYDGKWKLLDT